MPTWTYTPDGEGRLSQVSASSGQSPASSIAYNTFSQPTTVTFGSSDSDSFQFDSNTGRMTQYSASVNGSAQTGNLSIIRVNRGN